MKVYKNLRIVSEPSTTFSYLTENISSIVNELNEKVDIKLTDNEKRELASIRYAKQFISD